ncbi:serine/threonine-protein kinase ATM isoform X2 [Magnolia sinica]|uniref:serine/threonine-protein kinase ATM isoform X2 n=1 Tax=Magnolia sinica TaxID=86752 RepID=UPI00265960D4|nr:serine/threonine-protein kinase ATM isoform X2 [Magnolia sinica]
MATSRDIQEIVSKLSSEKVKSREEGVKLLSSWMEGERSFGFCKLLGQNTARLGPNEIPHAETWPFIITLLTKCIMLEISASKRRLPKLFFAKTLRSVIQHAEDAKFSGKTLPLLSVVKLLFSHIWDVIKDVPSFQSEYGIILRHLLAVREYRFHMRKRVYNSLVLLFSSQVQMAMGGKNSIQSNTKEEVFRCILTLHSLLENPPGDFPDNLREDLIKGFVGIFSHVREEGKISRKLIECINMFLIKDGPNLGSQSMEIHSAMQGFMFRCWLTTHDRGLKNALIVYARIQLKLNRSVADGSRLIELILDVVSKDLDQSNVVGTGIAWSDAARDDKVGALANSQRGLMELAASVFYQVCVHTTKVPSSEKRLKRESAAARLKDGLMKGKWLWYGAFCFLIRNYGLRISRALVSYWFEGICESFERILNDANTVHAYDGLLWAIRSLQELPSLLPLPTPGGEPLQSSITSSEVKGGWHIIWSCLMHGLPIFSNVTSVADASLMLLGCIISNDLINVPIVPQDVWDLRMFKHMTSMPALYFIACYFSWKGCQGDLRDVFHLRQTLLRAIFGLFNLKEPFVLNERMVMLLPAAIFSLCAGCTHFPSYSRQSFMLNSYIDILEAEDWTKTEDHDQGLVNELSECSVEVLAEIEPGCCVEVSQTERYHNLRLPRQVRHPLMQEMEDYFLTTVTSDQEIEKKSLSELFFSCAFLSNFIYVSMLTRHKEGNSTFLTKMLHRLLELLEHAVSVIQENLKESHNHGCLGSGPIDDVVTGSTLAAVRILIRSPLFSIWKQRNASSDELPRSIIQVIERLLLALANLFEEISKCNTNLESETDMAEFFPSSMTCPKNSYTMNDGKVRIVDMELDIEDESKDADTAAASGKNISGFSLSSVQLKLDMLSAISSFFCVLPDNTWEIMFDLMGKENDSKVHESMLHGLCQNFACSSTRTLSELVNSMNNMMKASLTLKLCCVNVVNAIHGLLGALLPSGSVGKDENVKQFGRGKATDQNLVPLGDLVNKVVEIGLIDWSARVKLIDCICYFVMLDPRIAQAMIERLLAMLQDTDYRVRLFLARRVGVLFQTWDGHDELFQDICSNFGIKLVMASKEKLVTAREVLATDVQPRLTMETSIVTLAHIAFCSEKVELEAIFMLCVVAAMDPCQRELVFAVLDNLSGRLQYTTRSKYLEELMGSILSCWVACGVSLVALVEYCCPWLLPPLILSENSTDLNWVSTVACQPLAVLAKNHFVPIFAVCMAFHCSTKSDKEKGAMVLRSSILHLAEISEHERDDLIKKQMVTIVSFLLSLSSSAMDPAIPFFSVDTIVLAIRTIVDGFLEMDDHHTNAGVIDKIHIFRPDRVFMFLVEIHHQITAAVPPRHRCHRLSGIEVLTNIIGHRVSVPSTCCYLFNLVGQFIGCRALQDQCCLILSTLLEAFKNNPTKDVTSVLGEQLQFLVSKLVACCIPSNNNLDPFVQSSRVLSLLHQLTVDADPSLYDYIRELEPFPELHCFERIHIFHQQLCKAYSPKDHFTKFVTRTCYLPQRLLLWSLQTLHKKLVMREIIHPEKNAEDIREEFNCWHCEPEIVSAVWTLVGMCTSEDAKDIRELVADFISRVGVGDPHCVVFRLPGDVNQKLLFKPLAHGEVGFYTDIGVSERLLIKLIRLLKKSLLDDSVKIVDMTARALRGILSTERGQSALLSFESYEKSLVEIHSKGINSDLVGKLLLDIERKSNAEAILLEDSNVWKTHGKTFEMWVCPLVYSLINHCSDTILRLCQDIVLLKAEVAELLFPVVLVHLAGKKDLNSDLCQLISMQVQENIFTESNDLVKSVQVMLDALNELRLHYVVERADTSSAPSKRESAKHAKPSSYSSRSRCASEKSKDASTRQNAGIMLSSSWKKVYWLSIDYLVVANSAIHCGSYFTSVMYLEHWCEDHFNSLTLGDPDFSHIETLPPHIELLVAAVTQINEPDSIYGIIQSHKLTSQIITYEHEGNWSKALEYYDLLVRTAPIKQMDGLPGNSSSDYSQGIHQPAFNSENERGNRKSYKGLMRSLQQTGCTHLLDVYCQGLTTQKGQFENDSEFTELQYEAAWRAGNWDFSLLSTDANSPHSRQHVQNSHFNENLHSCLRTLQEGDSNEFHMKLIDAKQELVFSISHASKESTEKIYSAIVKLQILDHLGMAWDLRWKSSPCETIKPFPDLQNVFHEPVIPSITQLELLNTDWSFILKRTQLHLNLLEPFIAFRRVLLQILNCKDCTIQHLLQAASTLRKGSRFSLAAAALHEFKFLSAGAEGQQATSYICSLGRLEEAKLLRAQGQHEMAINLARYILDHYQLNEEASNVHRLVGKWLAETRSSNSRTILEQYLKHAVELTVRDKTTSKKCVARQSQNYFHLAHYTDALFRSHEERLTSSEWQAALRLRRHKTKELEALIKRLKSSTKGEKTDYSVKIQELQKQLAMDREEAKKLQDDRDNFLSLALEGYQRCLVIGDKYDLKVVFRLVSLWFSLSSRQNVINGMLSAVKEVQSYKFIPLMYQIASRMGSSKDGQGSYNFQFALVSLVKKMAIDHPYHTIFQLLALANGDRVKDKQRSRNSFVVDMDKKLAAENLLNELSSHHEAIIRQMKQVVEIYIKLAELETKKEDINKNITLPREIRSLRQLELVPVVTATFPVDRSCQYHEGSFPHYKGLGDSIMVMNGINTPKVVECLGSDGHKYRQLAKSGNDDLRQDAVMEQFFGLVNTFLQNHRDTWKRRLGIRTYKVVPFTPSAGVLEWVDRTIPIGEYLIGSMRTSGAHGRYGIGDWTFLQCREYMATEKDKRKAFNKVCENFRPVMHYFFLERYLQPADWFENRLSYTRSVAASSMVGYIVGLGDRHSNNILIDQATAEVVHIDLGVAFEQGLMLKTPERVPFRLTRDIIDGMGVTGVEGVFRRCCEETLSVMRTNKEALLTIIEVFIHDPLYKWALSPLKALQRQKETDDDIESGLEDSQDVCEGNKDAARALMRVKQKLDGYEEGEMRSVQGQVQQLIQDAIDAEHLCQMFPGWGAWM